MSRNPVPLEAPVDPGAIPGFGPKYRTRVVGGKLLVREGSGKLRTLVASPPLYDVADPCAAWNAKRILFSAVQHPDSNWRVYEINADGSGLRQLTFTDRRLDLSQFGAAASLFTRYDDFDPCYLPDGRIVFASTRHPSMAMIGGHLTSNLYVMDGDGKNMHRISTERSGGEEPTVDPKTGMIVYSRWWVNVDRPSNRTKNGLTREEATALTNDIANIWHAATIRPDGNGLKLYAGFARTRFGSQTYKPSVMRDGTLLSVFSPRTSLDDEIGGTGIRWFHRGADFEHYVTGVKSDEALRRQRIIEPPYATDPVELLDGTLLLSSAADGKDYGISTCTLDGTGLTMILDLPNTLELEPQVLAARKVPPVLKDEYPPPVGELPATEDPETYYRNDNYRFDCMNVFMNGAVDEPMPDAPRITPRASIRFYINPQRQDRGAPNPSILFKVADVSRYGGVHEPAAPADAPAFEQLVDSNGTVLRTSSGNFAHVAGFNFERIGSGTKCVGCHTGHSMLTVPVNGAIAEWFNAAPSARANASSFFTSDDGKAFGPQHIVDRQARTGGDTVVWIANEGTGASIGLKWDVPIEIREFVLYGIPKNPKTGTAITVHGTEILLYAKSVLVGRAKPADNVSENGTHVLFLPTKIDSAKIVISAFTGTAHNKPVAGLAEVEVIARIF